MLKNFDGVTIGTKLKLRDDLNDEWHYNNVMCTPDMIRHRGEIVVATEYYCGSNPYYANCIHVGTSEDVDTTFCHPDGTWKWVWSPSMFECIVDNEVQPVSLIDLLSEGGTGNADTSD